MCRLYLWTPSALEPWVRPFLLHCMFTRYRNAHCTDDREDIFGPLTTKTMDPVLTIFLEPWDLLFEKGRALLLLWGVQGLQFVAETSCTFGFCKNVKFHSAAYPPASTSSASLILKLLFYMKFSEIPAPTQNSLKRTKSNPLAVCTLLKYEIHLLCCCLPACVWASLIQGGSPDQPCITHSHVPCLLRPSSSL